jgi:hypothetical protein
MGLSSRLEVQSDKPAKQPRSMALVLGALLALAGLALNPFSIAHLFLADQNFDSPLAANGLIALQVVLILSGLGVLWRRPYLPASPSWGSAALVLAGMAVVGCHGTARALLAARAQARLLEQLDRSEELLLRLAAKEMPVLAKSIAGGEIPDEHSRPIFAQTIRANDLSGSAFPGETLSALQVSLFHWPLEQGLRSRELAHLRLWRPFLDGVESFAHAQFHLERGHFPDGTQALYETFVLFDGLARMDAGTLAYAQARVKILWEKRPAAEAWDRPGWRIVAWETKEFKTTQSQELLFAEALERALPDRQTYERARASLHEQLVIRSFLDPNFKKPHPYFTVHAFDRHPGIVITDIDGDGWDDVYVVERWGKNLLFRNRGDGTFAEEAAAFGLDVENHTSSALFADFDNDGDVDAFLGCTLARSLYLVNEGGRLVDRSATLIEGALPFLVASISAADYDGDGLLDVYFSTYAARMLLEAVNASGGLAMVNGDALLSEFLPLHQARRLYRLTRARLADLVRDAPGPPNLLLKNLGNGRFAPAAEAHPLAAWRHTLQATWADYDRDGDPDLYLANDFAPNNLLRNDGQGRFADLTAQSGTADLGFGMGASWGDYDRDGWQDLYVTNMYSKAGRRITASAGPAGRRFAPMARGNTLFRNLQDRFARVSGLEPPALLVENGGWGWGGQFLDLDNDGYLDIYALSGFYTPPREVAIPEDA